MVTNAQVVKIAIASPGDVAEEREAIVETMEAWNAAYADSYGVLLRPVRWELDSAPEMGDRAQGIINKQMIDGSDALIAVFWTRLGTPTGEAESGTAEEIARLMDAGKPVAIYFSDRPVKRSEVNVEQEAALRAYREACSQNGLVSTFDSLGELREQLLRHLAKTVKQILARQDAQPVRNGTSSGRGTVGGRIAYEDLLRASPAQLNVFFRESARTVISDIEATRPDFDRFEYTDDAVVEQIGSARGAVTKFLESAEIASSLESTAGLLELRGTVERLLPYTHVPDGHSGAFKPREFDGFKFLAYEMYVGLVATLLKQQQWELLTPIISGELFDDSGERSGYKSVCRLSDLLESIDEVRNRRLNLRRASVVADIVKDLYAPGHLPLTHSEFMSADYFMFVKTICEHDVVALRDIWVPSSAILLSSAPAFVRKSESRAYLATVAALVGVSTETFVQRLQERHGLIAKFWPSAWIRGPLEDYDIARLGSRS